MNPAMTIIFTHTRGWLYGGLPRKKKEQCKHQTELIKL